MVYIGLLVGILFTWCSIWKGSSIGIYIGFVINITTFVLFIWGVTFILLFVPVLSLICKDCIEKIQMRKSNLYKG